MIGELTGPNGEPTAIIFLNGYDTQLHPTFIREVSLCDRWCLTQKLTLVKVQRISVCEVCSYAYDVSITPLSRNFRDQPWRRGRKIVRARGSGSTGAAQRHLRDVTGPCTHEPTSAVAGNRRPAGHWDNQHLTINGEGLGVLIHS